MKNEITELVLFPSVIYTIEKPEFLNNVKKISKEYLDKIKNEKIQQETSLTYQTDSFFHDSRLEDFTDFIGKTSYEILVSQGFNMNNYGVAFSELWLHEHHRHSGMPQHIHGHGSQITGFYFVQCPKESCKIIFNDPRPGKVQINLPEKDHHKATYASSMINFEPKEGQFMFTNSWLPHTFTNNESIIPFQFIHFNLHIQQTNNNCNVEVI